MKKITTTQKISFGAVLVLILTCVGYGFTLKHIKVLRQELVTIRQELVAEDKIAENKQVFISLLQNTKQSREELSGYFVPLDDPTPFLELVESVARDAGVVMSVEKLDMVTEDVSGAEKGKEKSVKVVLAVEGSWQEVYHFISLLEVLPYIVTITDSVFKVEMVNSTSFWKGQIHLNYVAR
jgi:hypothetical protein